LKKSILYHFKYIKMRNLKLISIFLVLILNACVEKNKDLNQSSSQSQKNRYNYDETCSQHPNVSFGKGDLILVKSTNLPLTGFRVEYNKDGWLESEEYYVNGRQDGLQKRFYRDGSLAWQEYYRDGLLDGGCEGWYENGRKRCKRYYSSGKLEGRCLWWFENGEVCLIENYNNGLRAGWQRRYLENGTLLYESNLVNGNGEISYKDAESGYLLTERYENGKVFKPSKGKDFDNPLPGIIEENSYDNGELNGMTKRVYTDDLKRKPFEFNYKNGLQHGIEKSWFVNGRLSAEKEYYFGQPNGVWQSWHENGKLEEVSRYDKGVLLSKKCWDESGKEIGCKCYNQSGSEVKCP
jgi:antitoxin component YwqK of YwqJK toxin-antitoxin module